MTFEPLHIIEVFVPTRCLLVPQQCSPADHGYAPAVDVGAEGVGRCLVERHSADFGEHLDAQGLHSNAVSGPFCTESVRVDTVGADPGAKSGECGEDLR